MCERSGAREGELSYSDLLVYEYKALVDFLDANPRVNRASIIYQTISNAYMGLLCSFVESTVTLMREAVAGGRTPLRFLRDMCEPFGFGELTDADYAVFQARLLRVYAILKNAAESKADDGAAPEN